MRTIACMPSVADCIGHATPGARGWDAVEVRRQRSRVERVELASSGGDSETLCGKTSRLHRDQTFR